MKKSHMIFGLTDASYDNEALALYPIRSFSSYDEAADWLKGEYESWQSVQPQRDPYLATFTQCIILDVFEPA